MRRDRSSWTAARLATELRGSPEGALETLAKLAERRLIAVDAAGAYRYETGTRDSAVAELAQAYKEARYKVIEVIFNEPPAKPRILADMFRIGRRKG